MPTITIVHTTPILRAPSLSAPTQGIAEAGAALSAARLTDGFWELSDGGYVPNATSAAQAVGTPQSPAETIMAQTVAIYTQPLPGKQFSAQPAMGAWWAAREGERLQILGHDDRFALIQLYDGRIGYVPVSTCIGGQRRIGGARRWNLEMVLLGGGWYAINGATMIVVVSGFGRNLNELANLALAAGLIALLWLLSAHRTAARSFAIGILLASLVGALILRLS